MKCGVLVLLCALALLAPAFWYPDSFGNQPDAVADESYFLTSSLQALQKHTLPGWEFSASGAYYGGVQVYVDTVVLAPVLLAVVAFTHSVSGAELWVALHTGTLMQVLRLTNGAVLLGVLFLFAWYFLKRRIPQPLALQFLLLLALLLGNSLVVMIAHTAKVWLFYIVLEGTIGTLVLAQDYYLRHQREPFITKPRYVGLLLWLTALAFFQTFLGVMSAGLWLVWAWWLGHFTLPDIVGYLRRWWYLFVALALTQVSFIWRALFERTGGGFFDPGDANGGNPINWAHRFLAPPQIATVSQPFVLLYVVLLVLVCIPAYRQMIGRSGRYLAVAILHPLLVYLLFYPLFGLDLFPRYIVMLTIALTFSVVMLVPLRGVIYKVLVFCASVLAGAVLLHAVFLYWSPSYQVQLVNQLETHYNAPQNVFVLDSSAVTLQLPMNGASLQSLDATGQGMSRYAYLLSHLSAVDGKVTFAPLVLYTHTVEERDEDISQQEKSGNNVFLITVPPGVGNTAEPNTLPAFFASGELGTAYTLQRVFP